MGTEICTGEDTSFASDYFFQMSYRNANYANKVLLKQIQDEGKQGKVVVGNWPYGGEQTGIGIIYDPRGRFYDGNILKGQAYGYGALSLRQSNTNAVYTGLFNKGQAQGHGYLVNEDHKMRLKGMWKNGFPRAGETMDLSVDKYRHKLKFLQEEVIVKNDYQVYIEFKNGVKYYGIIQLVGESFKVYGKGMMMFPDGSSYKGDFKDCKMHGYGIYTWVNYHRYEGEYKNNKRDGQGNYYINNKLISKGLWEDGRLKGNFRIEH